MEMKERFVTLTEVKEMLEKEQEEREELSKEQNLALEHATRFTMTAPKKAEKLVNDLQKREKMSESIAYKIADVCPTHPDDVRAIFARERFTLEEDEVKEIIELVEKHL